MAPPAMNPQSAPPVVGMGLAPPAQPYGYHPMMGPMQGMMPLHPMQMQAMMSGQLPPGYPFPFQGMMQPQMNPMAMGMGMDRDTTRAMVQKQVDYYFSVENLTKDMYLRRQMNDEGWVNIHVIAGFNRLRKLLTPPMAAQLGIAAAAAASDISLLLEALEGSRGIEVDPTNTLVRVRDIWSQYVLPESQRGEPSPPRSPAKGKGAGSPKGKGGAPMLPEA